MDKNWMAVVENRWLYLIQGTKAASFIIVVCFEVVDQSPSIEGVVHGQCQDFSTKF